MSATASDSGHRADDRRGPGGRRGTEIRRRPQEHERELRRYELAVGRSLTQVLPTDRPARLRELADARRALATGIRDLRQLMRELEADLQRYAAPRSHNQREVLAYEAVAGEIDEVLERWEARRDQLTDAIERGGRSSAKAGRGGRPNQAAGRGEQSSRNRQGDRRDHPNRAGREGRGEHRGQGGPREGRSDPRAGQGSPRTSQGNPKTGQGSPKGGQGNHRGDQGGHRRGQRGQGSHKRGQGNQQGQRGQEGGRRG